MDINIFIILLKYMAISVFIFIIIIFVLINLYPLLFYKSPVTKLKRDKFDVIIILGFPALQNGKPSPIMRERVIKAVELFNRGCANNIICSGGGVYNKYIEADVMVDFAESLGIPNSCLIKEDKSSNTYQNIQNSIKIMKDKNWSSAMVVTSPWHLRRSNYFLSKFNITYKMEKSDYPKEFSYIYIVAIYMWENYVMTKNKIRGH
ncbi:YdcF family protein [Clostridium oceanicum]|uniref:YdcF family protein n=1 Tax=Clostridium oceanicum TaxID=1543 RepID=A0ABP3UVG8_9CLOT